VETCNLFEEDLAIARSGLVSRWGLRVYYVLVLRCSHAPLTSLLLALSSLPSPRVLSSRCSGEAVAVICAISHDLFLFSSNLQTSVYLYIPCFIPSSLSWCSSTHKLLLSFTMSSFKIGFRLDVFGFKFSLVFDCCYPSMLDVRSVVEISIFVRTLLYLGSF